MKVVSIFGMSLVPSVMEISTLKPKTETQTIPRHNQTVAQRKRDNRSLMIGYTGSRLLPPWLDLF